MKWNQEAVGWLEYFQKTYPVWENDEKVVEVYNQLKSSREKWGDRASFGDKSYDIEEPLKIKARDYELRFGGHLSGSSEVNFVGKSLIILNITSRFLPKLQVKLIKCWSILRLSRLIRVYFK